MKRASTPRHICQLCLDHRALFRYRGRWYAKRDHDLCRRCFRSLMDQLRSQRLLIARDSAEAPIPFAPTLFNCPRIPRLGPRGVRA